MLIKTQGLAKCFGIGHLMISSVICALPFVPVGQLDMIVGPAHKIIGKVTWNELISYWLIVPAGIC